MRYIIILLILCSCSAQQRAMRHLKRAKILDPSILDTAMIKIDSILFLSKDSSYVDSVAEEAKDLIDSLL